MRHARRARARSCPSALWLRRWRRRTGRSTFEGGRHHSTTSPPFMAALKSLEVLRQRRAEEDRGARRTRACKRRRLHHQRHRQVRARRRGHAPADAKGAPRRARGKARPWSSSSSASPRLRSAASSAWCSAHLVAHHRRSTSSSWGCRLGRVHQRHRGADRAGRGRAQEAQRRVHREAVHRQRPEPLPARARAPGAAAQRGARRAAREKKIDELLQALPGPGAEGGPGDRQHRAQGPGDEPGSTPRSPSSCRSTGNYHEIATFFDALGRLRRIVNVSDIVLDTPRTIERQGAPQRQVHRRPPSCSSTQDGRGGRRRQGQAEGGQMSTRVLALVAWRWPRPAAASTPPPPRRRAPRPSSPRRRRPPPRRPASPAEPECAYSSVGKRDPFRSFLAELAPGERRLHHALQHAARPLRASSSSSWWR